MRLCPLLVPALLLFSTALFAGESAWTGAKANHWAWKPPVRPALPKVQDAAWTRNPIDAFILARLEAAGVKPAPPATREQLIRRVKFDLIGLPPTPAEVDAFVNDHNPDAWEKVVDRMLVSPHYGERWGRHWLDLARFAESNGYEFDEPRPNAWRFRDYVIAAFNADKPYDRFIAEQLAGDELYPYDPQALIATGFNLLGPDMTDAANQAQRRQNTLEDMTDTTGLAFLGLTVGCARCHNHKFEPITARDYFRLQAFFTPAEFRRDHPVPDAKEKAEYDKRMTAYLAATADVRAKLNAMEAPYRKQIYDKKFAALTEIVQRAHRTPEAERSAVQKEIVANTARKLVVSAQDVAAALTKDDKARHAVLQQELKKFDARKPALPTAMALQETGKTPKTFLLRRGELRNPVEEVQPGWLSILSPDMRGEPASIKTIAPTSSGRRAALAKWIASPQHPLTARVMVNRIWQHHFGRGIVASPSDFGLRGDRPTHPELLDWLACEFSSTWSIKRMHRLMLLSATYQQSTIDGVKKDPNNALFGRSNRQRLEGEIIRDSLLAISGRLNPKMGGPGVFPPIPPEAGVSAKQWKASADGADHVRRSVYIFARRNLRFPFLEPFDVPDSNQSCPKRERSTTAPQALALLNSSDVIAAARVLADRLDKDAPDTDARITLAYRLTLGRTPTDTERRLSREFVAQSPWSELCRALFNVNEFIYLD
ncbi:MAG TPA: DUF1549 and DUF1553 domain-containing protein [Gemmataceae bacterium]|nr:DUF1549 and DUF1553 domain-containing protein [Gemmataceae bacterium]